MALLKCPDCGKDVSDKATVCPNCGCPSTEFHRFVDNKNDGNIRFDGVYFYPHHEIFQFCKDGTVKTWATWAWTVNRDYIQELKTEAEERPIIMYYSVVSSDKIEIFGFHGGQKIVLWAFLKDNSGSLVGLDYTQKVFNGGSIESFRPEFVSL